ncbi:MAG: polysaccharide deacetylase family protein [Fluviibacter sp.]
MSSLHTHSVMFHHFHDDGKHPKSQGSLSASDFEMMIDWLSTNYQILGADDYAFRLESNSLKNNQICLSFDDALLGQYDIAVPILKDRGIKAFFFVYSSPLCGDPDPLEIYRHFRSTKFAKIDDFYDVFFIQTKESHPEVYADALKNFDADQYLSSFPFYTKNDKYFRFLRDMVLGKLKYEQIMNSLMTKLNFDVVLASQSLWMNNEHIKLLHENGHNIGLHSYSHPTTMHTLSKKAQELEYKKNFEHLESVLKARPMAMSHPCGNYNEDTLKIMEKLGIKIGFRSSNYVKHIKSNLEVPRNDHANVYNEMKNENYGFHKQSAETSGIN